MRRKPPASWKELLAHPGPDGHIVQLYQDDDFCCEAVAHFAGSGLTGGEAVVLVATQQHWDDVSLRLTQSGFDVARLSRGRQLAFIEAGDALSKFMLGALPDASAFRGWIEQTVDQARVGGNFSGVRVWGEMANILYLAGNRRGYERLEELFHEAVHENSIAVLCSFLMDKYDPRIYEEDFGNVCRTHSYIISAEDDACHRHAVNRAISEVIGEIKGPLFRSLALWNGMPCAMLSAQALLLWVKDTLPVHFMEVMTRAREYEIQTRGHA